jgi:hypothetical protein
MDGVKGRMLTSKFQNSQKASNQLYPSANKPAKAGKIVSDNAIT